MTAHTNISEAKIFISCLPLPNLTNVSHHTKFSGDEFSNPIVMCEDIIHSIEYITQALTIGIQFPHIKMTRKNELLCEERRTT